MAPRYPVLTQNSNKVFNDLRKLDGFGAELEKMIGAGRAADGITSADVAEYLAKLGTEAQNTRYRLSTTITKTDLDQLENKLAEFKAVEFNLPPSSEGSTFQIPDAKLGYFQVKNDDRETVEALVSLYNQGIIDNSWNFQPINASNDSGVVLNIDNIIEAAGSPSQLQTFSPNHLMSSMAHKDYELSFFMTVKDTLFSSAFFITEIVPTADAFAYKYVDLDVLLNEDSTDAKNQNDAFIATNSGAMAQPLLNLSDEIKVSVYRIAGEIAIRIEDKDGNAWTKTFTCGESAHFGFLANPNVSIRGINMNGIRAVIDERYNDGAGFAYNVLSSEGGDVITYQFYPAGEVGWRGYIEGISLRAGRFVSEFRYDTRTDSDLYQAGNGRFILSKIGYGQTTKYALIGTDVDASIAPLTMEIEAFNDLVEPLFGDYKLLGMHETVNPDTGNTVLKVYLDKSVPIVDPYATDLEKAAGLTFLNNLEAIRVVSLERISDTEWSGISEEVEIKIPPKYFLLAADRSSPGNIVREPSGQSTAEVNAKIGYRAYIGYKVVESETEALKKVPLVLILLDGVLVGELPMLAYTWDEQALTDISGETPLSIDLSKYKPYINCVSSDDERVMVLAGVGPRTSEFATPPQGNRWGIASTINIAEATTLKEEVLASGLETWQTISATIYNVEDDRFGSANWTDSDPTKITNLDTYGYGQTICLSRNILVAPCRDSYYKSVAVYKIHHAQPPNYSIGFMGSPPTLELRCIVETHEPSGRWQAGAFNRVTVNSRWLAMTDWNNGNLHVISIDSLMNGRDRIIKALPEDFSNSVNNYRVTRPESAAQFPMPSNTVLAEGSFEYVEEGTDMATVTAVMPKIVVADDTSFTYDNKTFTLDTETKTYSHGDGGDVLVITFAASTPTFTVKRNDVLEFTGEYWRDSLWEPNKYSFTTGGAGIANGLTWSGKGNLVGGTVITAAAARALIAAYNTPISAGVNAGYYQLI